MSSCVPKDPLSPLSPLDSAMSPGAQGTHGASCPCRVPGHHAPLHVGGPSLLGHPVLLWLPLGSLFLHHILEPARPCRSFCTCARATRDRQSFHQDTHTWDDIGCRSLSPPEGAVIVPL